MAKVYPNGTVQVNVPSGSKLLVQTAGTANVFQVLVTPNQPPGRTVLSGSPVINRAVQFSPSAATDVIIEAIGPEPVNYEVAVTPNLFQDLPVRQNGTLTAKTVAVTLTAAELATGIITGTHAAGATQAYTLPTGANMDALTIPAGVINAASLEIGDAFDWSLLNLSAAAADSITLTANTNHTIVGTGIVASAHSTTGGLTGGNTSRWRTRKTAAATYETIRIG